MALWVAIHNIINLRHDSFSISDLGYRLLQYDYQLLQAIPVTNILIGFVFGILYFAGYVIS